jgi:hypothetical protein
MTSALTLSYTPENLETDGNNRPNRRAFVNRNSESTLKVSAQRGTNVQDPVCNVFRAACLYSLKRSGTENLDHPTRNGGSSSRCSGRQVRGIDGVDAEGWRFVAFVRLVPLFQIDAIEVLAAECGGLARGGSIG